MKTRAFLWSIAAAALLSACTQSPAPVPVEDTTAADEAAVRGLTDGFVAAWNTGDAAALGAMIAPDIVELPQGRPANIGRDAVLAAVSAGYDIAVMQQSATVAEVVVMGDYANAYGSWRLDTIVATDPPVESTVGKWMALYHRNAGGTWQIWRWMWNQTSGPPLSGA